MSFRLKVWKLKESRIRVFSFIFKNFVFLALCVREWYMLVVTLKDLFYRIVLRICSPNVWLSSRLFYSPLLASLIISIARHCLYHLKINQGNRIVCLLYTVSMYWKKGFISLIKSYFLLTKSQNAWNPVFQISEIIYKNVYISLKTLPLQLALHIFLCSLNF